MFLKTKLRYLKKSNANIYQTGDILPVLSAQELLAAGRHHAIVEQLRSICGVPEEYFDSLYLGVINNFAEYVQVLPTEVNGPLSGLLNQSIARAVITLKNFILEQGKKIDTLLNYAVFTAALLLDVNKIVINHKIVLVDRDGMFVDDWRPFEGSMLGRGDYYKIYETAPVYQRLQQSVILLLARQIMPELGFLWIAGDPKVFAEWLDALHGDSTQGGRVKHALSIIRRDDTIGLEHSLPEANIEPITSEKNKYGEAFLQWLRQGINNGDIKVNSADAHVHIVNEGVLLERALFKQFVDMLKLPVNMNVVFAQLGNLFGIAKKGGYDYAFTQYFSEYPQAGGQAKSFQSPLSHRQRSLRDGMVLGDPSVIFTNATIPAVTPMLKALQSKKVESSNLPPARNQMKQELVKN